MVSNIYIFLLISKMISTIAKISQQKTHKQIKLTSSRWTCSCSHKSPGVKDFDTIQHWWSCVFGQEGSGGLFLPTQIPKRQRKARTHSRQTVNQTDSCSSVSRYWFKCTTPTGCKAWCRLLSISPWLWRAGWSALACPQGDPPPAAGWWSRGGRCGPPGPQSESF